MLVEIHGEVVWNLSARGDDDTVRLLHVDDVHDALEGELVEIKTVAHVVVGRHCLWVIVDHDRPVTLLADGVQGLHATPVELNGRAYAISS